MSALDLSGFFDYTRIGGVFAPDDSLVSRIDESYAQQITAGFLRGREVISVPSNLLADTFLRRIGANGLGPDQQLFIAVGSVFFKIDGGALLGKTSRHPVILVPVWYDTAWGKVELRAQGAMCRNIGLREYFIAGTGTDIYEFFDDSAGIAQAVGSLGDVLHGVCGSLGYRYDMTEVNLVLADVTEEREYLSVVGCDKVSSMPGFPIIDTLFARDSFAVRAPGRVPDADRLTRPDSLCYLRNSDMSRLLAVSDTDLNSCVLLDITDDRSPQDNLVNLAAKAVGNDERMLVMSRDPKALDAVEGALEQAGLGSLYVRLTGDVREDNRRIVNAYSGAVEFCNKMSSGLSAPKIAGGYQTVEENREALRAFYRFAGSKVGQAGFDMYRVCGSLLALERKFAEADSRVPDAELQGCLKWNSDALDARCRVVQEFDEKIKAIGPVHSNPFWGSGVTDISEEDYPELVSELDALRDKVVRLQSAGSVLADAVRQQAPVDIKKARYLSEPVMYLAERPATDGIDIEDTAWERPHEVLEQAENAAKLQVEYEALKAQTGGFVAQEPSEYTVDDLRRWRDFLKADRFNIFRKDHRLARKQLRDYFSPEWKKMKQPERLKLTENRVRMMEIEESFDQGSDALRTVLFGDLSVNSDFGQVSSFAQWFMKFENAEFRDNDYVRSLRTSDYDSAEMRRKLDDYEAAADGFRGDLQSFLSRVQLGVYDIVLSFRFANMISQIDVWQQNVSRLGEIAEYNRCADKLRQLGLAGIAQLAAKWSGRGVGLVDVLRINYFRTLRTKGFAAEPGMADMTTEELCRLMDINASIEQGLPRINYDKAMLTYVEKIKLSTRNAEFMKDYASFQEFCRDGEARARCSDNLLDRFSRVVRVFLPILIAPAYAAVNIPARVGNGFDMLVIPTGDYETPYSCLGGILRSKQAAVFARKGSPEGSLAELLRIRNCPTRVVRDYSIDTVTASRAEGEDDPFRDYIADVAESAGLQAERPSEGTPVLLFIRDPESVSPLPLAAVVADTPSMTEGRSVREYGVMLDDFLRKEKIRLIRTSSVTWGKAEIEAIEGLKPR